MAAASPAAAVPDALDPELRDRLHRLAAARHRTPARRMHEAVAQYLGREEARERLRADVLAAWADYESKGQHATGEAADVWLARLESGEDAPIPACRA